MRTVDSPNHDERPPRRKIAVVVLHSISVPPGEYGGDSIERLFTNCLDPEAHPYFREVCGLKVSAHFLVRRDGSMLPFVPVAGASAATTSRSASSSKERMKRRSSPRNTSP